MNNSTASMNQCEPTSIKALFIISSWGHGRGGHFYSLKTIREALPIPSCILNIGTTPSPVFSDDNEVKFLSLSRNKVTHLDDAVNYVKQTGATHIHSFDNQSHIYGSFLSAKCRLPWIATKPGGPPPNGWYPCCRYQTTFTEEDRLWFQSRALMRPERIDLIPNRIEEFQLDAPTISEIRQRANGKLICLRIARLSKEYRNSILQTIRLTDRLRERGVDIIPVIIGSIQDEDVHHDIKKCVQEANGLLLAEDKYTINAKRLVGCADIVVGSGRSFLEAAITGRITMASVLGGKLPVLINEHNYAQFFRSNFTGRGTTQANELDDINTLCALFSDDAQKQSYIKYLKGKMTKDFAIAHGAAKYIHTYTMATKPANLCRAFVNLAATRMMQAVSNMRMRLRQGPGHSKSN